MASVHSPAKTIFTTPTDKARNEMQSGVIYVRASQDGIPTILFSNFPSPNVEVSYQEASNRLLSLVENSKRLLEAKRAPVPTSRRRIAPREI